VEVSRGLPLQGPGWRLKLVKHRHVLLPTMHLSMALGSYDAANQKPPERQEQETRLTSSPGARPSQAVHYGLDFQAERDAAREGPYVGLDGSREMALAATDARFHRQSFRLREMHAHIIVLISLRMAGSTSTLLLLRDEQKPLLCLGQQAELPSLWRAFPQF